MRLRRSIHLGEFRSPRWRKQRRWKFGRYEDHPDYLDERKGLNAEAQRGSYRVQIEVASTSPVYVSHRKDIRGQHEWSLKVPAEQFFGLSIGRSSGNGSSASHKRNVDWYDLRAGLTFLGQRVSIDIRTPYWRETREDFLHDKGLSERRWAAYLEARRRSGCQSKEEIGYPRLERGAPGRSPDIVRPGADGEPVLVSTDVSFRCAADDPGCYGTHGRHWVYDEDLVAVMDEEFMSARHRRQKEEAERLAEVAASIREA